MFWYFLTAALHEQRDMSKQNTKPVTYIHLSIEDTSLQLKQHRYITKSSSTHLYNSERFWKASNWHAPYEKHTAARYLFREGGDLRWSQRYRHQETQKTMKENATIWGYSLNTLQIICTKCETVNSNKVRFLCYFASTYVLSCTIKIHSWKSTVKLYLGEKTWGISNKNWLSQEVIILRNQEKAFHLCSAFNSLCSIQIHCNILFISHNKILNVKHGLSWRSFLMD
jgi:hypothetical protein